ncbi:cyclase family protein [Actinomadura roseirufa]|uniref:cyclase family protein n=1 Tax=Actinomadura roseirufa TaxID=2094049 RepID=UPI0010413746|nr:cyclase family protein [Actinomadura roseirufa]
MCVPTMIDEITKSKIAAFSARFREVTQSPFGKDDEIGMLNLMDAASRRAVLGAADHGTVFDLSVDYFIGMPSWTKVGDPGYQIWMTHTPPGSVIDDAMGVGREQERLVAYSGDAISMYTHCGTHIDTLTHFGYNGRIFNGFSAEEHLGSRHWTVAGADKHPPVIARGIMLDVAALHGVDMLPDGYGIGRADLEGCLRRQGIELRPGDVVLVRTGRMRAWPDHTAYAERTPGLALDGAVFLAQGGAILIGTDSLSVEQAPSADPENYNNVHTYLLGEAGVTIMEVAQLEALAGERVYEFAFVGACLRLRGATGAPMRPVVMPLLK